MFAESNPIPITATIPMGEIVKLVLALSVPNGPRSRLATVVTCKPLASARKVNVPVKVNPPIVSVASVDDVKPTTATRTYEPAASDTV